MFRRREIGNREIVLCHMTRTKKKKHERRDRFLERPWIPYLYRYIVIIDHAPISPIEEDFFMYTGSYPIIVTLRVTALPAFTSFVLELKYI